MKKSFVCLLCAVLTVFFALPMTSSAADTAPVTENRISSITAVGNGKGNYLNGVSWDPTSSKNRMRAVTGLEGVYEINYEDVAAGKGYQLKFTANNSSDFSWGAAASSVDSGKLYDAVFGGEMISFDVAEVSDVKLRLDLREWDSTSKTGARFAVRVTPLSSMHTMKINLESFLDNSENCVIELESDTDYYRTARPGNNVSHTFYYTPDGSYTLTVSKKAHVTRQYQVVVDGDSSFDARINPVGDVNLDGLIQARDAMKAFQHTIEPSLTDYALLCADVNGNGKVEARDAMRIFQQTLDNNTL
nr:dockerin type I domain-containing protein [uncultured Ruminococcus sp.]